MWHQFCFSLLGIDIVLRSSDSDLAYMEKVFRSLENKIEETQNTFGLDDALKTAIIAAFLLTNDLLKEREQLEKLLPYEEGLQAEKLVNQLLKELQGLPQLNE